MSKYIAIAGMLIIMMVNVPMAPAEKATELYIPIGQSPGLSFGQDSGMFRPKFFQVLDFPLPIPI